MKKVDAFGYITICNSIDTVRISAIFEIDDPTNFSMGNLNKYTSWEPGSTTP